MKLSGVVLVAFAALGVANPMVRTYVTRDSDGS